MRALGRFADANRYLSGLLGLLFANMPLVDWLGMSLLSLTGLRRAGWLALAPYISALSLSLAVWYWFGYPLATIALSQGLLLLLLFRRGGWHIALPGLALFNQILLVRGDLFPPQQLVDSLIQITRQLVPNPEQVLHNTDFPAEYISQMLPRMMVGGAALVALLSLALGRRLQAGDTDNFRMEFNYLRLNSAQGVVWLLLLGLIGWQLGRAGLALAELPLTILCLAVIYGLPLTGRSAGAVRGLYWLLLAVSAFLCLYGIPEPLALLAGLTLLLDTLIDPRGRRLVTRVRQSMQSRQQ